jgi:hypothetical protein
MAFLVRRDLGDNGNRLTSSRNSSVRNLEQLRLRLPCVGEPAAFLAEQFGLQEVLRNGKPAQLEELADRELAR